VRCVCSKGDFDGAVAQYIKTIGKLEPSYVIRKVNFCNAYTMCSRKTSPLNDFQQKFQTIQLTSIDRADSVHQDLCLR